MTALAALKLLALLAMLGVAVTTDLRERRIPNRLTVTGALAAVALSTFEGSGAFGASLAGMLAALGLSIPFFALGAVGAGDAKLLAAVGAFVGIGGLVPVLLYSAVAGGLLGVASAVRRGVILPALLQTSGLLIHAVTLGRRGSRTTIDDPNAQTIPYGVAIAAGTVVAFLLPLSIGVAS
ncbi:MAG TPA: prepilin peptidase [Longimicrobiales bacterium]|nr:prepilin peptidase [Longimicrobiales bacterium]